MAVVGVSGHRILAEFDKIHQGIDQALARIQERFPNQTLRLLTQLADGADRLVAEHFFNHPGWRVVAVLPMPLREYLDDFSEDSKETFLKMLQQCEDVLQMPGTENRDAAYEAAGMYIVDSCEAMICIWDGNPEQGRGGTGAIVHRVRERKIPFGWIHAGNRVPGSLNPTSLGKQQGMVTFEQFE